MNCNEAYKFFKYSLNNKLNSNQISDLNSHLQECEKCRKIFEEVDTTYNTVEFINSIQPGSPYFFPRLMAAIENRKSQKQLPAFVKLKPALITTWFLIAFVLGITLGSNFINTIESVKYTSSSELNNDESFIDVFNLSEVDKESLEYLLLQ